MAAFIRRANQGIPNEKYRPEVFWRPPRGSSALVDLRGALAQRVEVPEEGRYYLENPGGVRLADFHGGRGAVRLLRPAGARLYLRRTRDDREFVLPADAGVLSTAALQAQEPHVVARSAAHEAFTALWSLPFDARAVEEVLARPEGLLEEPAEAAPPLGARRVAGLSLIGVGALAAAGGTWAYLSARSLRDDVAPGASQEAATSTNQRITTRNRLAVAGAGLAGAALLTGALLWLWPDSPPAAVSVSTSGVMLELKSVF
jgi:hypothetical protein